MKDKVEEFIKNRKIYDKAMLNFHGIDGWDVYNCSIPFIKDGKKYIYGRVEKRDEWASSWVRLFEEKEKDNFYAVSDVIYQLEDPFIQFIDGELILGGTHVLYDGGKYSMYRSYFYRGFDLKNLKYFTSGPEQMKDIRLVQLDDGIGVFSRPNGKIGFTVIKDLSELTMKNIADAPIIEAIGEGEYGGCNQCYNIGNGFVGIIGHQAYWETKIKRCYINMAYVMDVSSREIIDKKIIGTRDCYTDSVTAKPTQNGTDLSFVTFSSGIVMRKDGKADLYSGVNDIGEGRITIDDPFAQYNPYGAKYVQE